MLDQSTSTLRREGVRDIEGEPGEEVRGGPGPLREIAVDDGGGTVETEHGDPGCLGIDDPVFGYGPASAGFGPLDRP
jgi:hypothetical protein